MGMPKGMRLHVNSRMDGVGVVVIERPPQTRHIRIIGEHDRWYHIALPYMVFAIYYEVAPIVRWLPPPMRFGVFYKRLCVAWRRLPLKDMTDKVSNNYMPAGGLGGICLGDFKTGPFWTVGQCVRATLNRYWHTPFSDGSNGITLDHWQAMTKQDPSFIMRAEFWSEYLTLNEWLLLPTDTKLQEVK